MDWTWPHLSIGAESDPSRSGAFWISDGAHPELSEPPMEVRVQCWRARRTCLGARQSSGRGESGEARRFREVREAQVNAPVECSQGDPGVEEGG